MNEQWTDKYKRSIDCDNPKGFSQRAHCQGKKKTFKELREYMFGTSVGPIDIQKPMASMGSSGQFFPNRKYATTLPALTATYQGPGFGTYKPMVSASKRIPRKPGQPVGSDKHSDLYTDENPKGTIQGLGFTDKAKAKQSVNKIKNSGKTHAHKIQAAIAMSQRAKVASERAKDPKKKKDLGAAHRVYQSFIDTNKKKD